MVKQNIKSNNKIISIIISFLLLISTLIIYLRLDVFIINGKSMEPTYSNQEKIIKWKKSNIKISRGDIVIIKESPYFENKDKYFIKRAIGISGDLLAFVYDNNYISLYRKINDTWSLINEPYIKEKMNDIYFQKYEIYKNIDNIINPIIVEEGTIFVLGDNRNNSIDSRVIGLINMQDIINCISYSK